MVEEWRDIAGFPGYQASSLGRLKTLAKICYSPRGGGYRFTRRERVLIGKPDKNWGYISHSVKSITQPDKQTFLAHRLVALAFIDNPESKPFINHKNGIKTDNRPENLEWCTKSENGIHAVQTGLHTALRGETNGNSILKPEQVVSIRAQYESGMRTQWSLAREFKIGRTTVQRIIKRELWAHV